MDRFDIAIIGGGAAGLATAIFAARCMPARRIAILDGAAKLGAKILVAGGGRCNVTNRVVRPDDFFGGSPHIIKRVLNAFNEQAAVEFFEELGVPMHEEAHGKLFPNTNRARTVLDALLREARRLDVSMLTGHRVGDIAPNESDFSIAVDRGLRHEGDGSERILAQQVVLATGGKSLPKTGSDGAGYEIVKRLGHSIVETTPALVPLILGSGQSADLSGVSHEAELCVRVEGTKPVRMRGDLLWTHFGISGPVVLDASRHWHRARVEGRDVIVSLSFLPGRDLADVDTMLISLGEQQPRTQLHNVMATILPARLADKLLMAANVRRDVPMGQLPKSDRRRLATVLTAFELKVVDCRGYGYAEVTAGGVPLTEIDGRTMASRKCPGLFLVGEILDVDGRIGGFNFQWAWSSGFVAGAGLAAAFEPLS